MAMPSFQARYIASTGYTANTVWSDQSGNGNDIISSPSSGTRPVQTVTPDGLTCLRFNGSTARLALPAGVAWNRQNMSVYVVCRTYGSAVTGKGAPYGNNSGTLLLIEEGASLKAAVYTGVYNRINRTHDGLALWGCRLSGAAAKCTYHAEEVSFAAFGAASGTGGTVGAQDGIGSNAWAGDIYEVFITAAPWSDAELTSVRAYCVATYGTGSDVKGDLIVYHGNSLMTGALLTSPFSDYNLPTMIDSALRLRGISNPKWINAAQTGWVTGIPKCTFVSADGTTATWTLANHGFTTSDTVVMAGSSVGGYNGSKTITVTNANTFTFLTATTGTPTGTITASNTAAGATYGAFRGSPDTTVRSLYGDLDTSSAVVTNMTAWLAAHSGYNRVLLVTDAGVNDILTAASGDACTASQLAARQTAYWAKALAIGFSGVVQLTTTVAGDGATEETVRLANNTTIRSSGTSYSDVGGPSSILGVFANRTNATYFQGDHLHWTVTGTNYAANIVQLTLDPLAPVLGGGGGVGAGAYATYY